MKFALNGLKVFHALSNMVYMSPSKVQSCPMASHNKNVFPLFFYQTNFYFFFFFILIIKIVQIFFNFCTIKIIFYYYLNKNKFFTKRAYKGHHHSTIRVIETQAAANYSRMRKMGNKWWKFTKASLLLNCLDIYVFFYENSWEFYRVVHVMHTILTPTIGNT